MREQPLEALRLVDVSALAKRGRVLTPVPQYGVPLADQGSTASPCETRELLVLLDAFRRIIPSRAWFDGNSGAAEALCADDELRQARQVLWSYQLRRPLPAQEARLLHLYAQRHILLTRKGPFDHAPMQDHEAYTRQTLSALQRGGSRRPA